MIYTRVFPMKTKNEKNRIWKRHKNVYKVKHFYGIHFMTHIKYRLYLITITFCVHFKFTRFMWWDKWSWTYCLTSSRITSLSQHIYAQLRSSIVYQYMSSRNFYIFFKISYKNMINLSYTKMWFVFLKAFPLWKSKIFW